MLMCVYRIRRRKLLPKSVAPLVVAVMLALGVVVLVLELIDIRVLVLWLQEDEGAVGGGRHFGRLLRTLCINNHFGAGCTGAAIHA